MAEGTAPPKCDAALFSGSKVICERILLSGLRRAHRGRRKPEQPNGSHSAYDTSTEDHCMALMDSLTLGSKSI
jgi:hypothetical protein